jgi:hypothetical protein
MTTNDSVLPVGVPCFTSCCASFARLACLLTTHRRNGSYPARRYRSRATRGGRRAIAARSSSIRVM